ncbi:MAG: hypothetical protein K8W52_01260 [Deltaproteobacteria bacterium]|nr:hypothetical protein [Deltaproteobacteria bacterium]
MRPLLAPCLAALALGCGHHASPTIGNTAPTAAAAPAPVVTLDEDLAVLDAMAAPQSEASTWTTRATVLGWTADHRLAYRALICDPDALGGRGSYCELNLCTVASGVAEPACEPAASFELGGETGFDRAATTASAEKWLASLGPLAAGAPQEDDAANLVVAAHALIAELPPGAPRLTVVSAPFSGEDMGQEDLGVTEVSTHTIVDSPDGTCRGAAGIVQYQGEYEGVRGLIPIAFGVVRCGLGAP